MIAGRDSSRGLPSAHMGDTQEAVTLTPDVLQGMDTTWLGLPLEEPYTDLQPPCWGPLRIEEVCLL